jgi:hypothetical protein
MFEIVNGYAAIETGFGVFKLHRCLSREIMDRWFGDSTQVLRFHVTFGTLWNSRFIVASSIKIGDADAIY